MSRSVTITLPAAKRRQLVPDLETAQGVISISVLPDASVKPQGDVLLVSTTNEGMQSVLGLLERHDVGEGASVETSEPRSLISPTAQEQLDKESNEGSWPEMAALLRRDTNITLNYLLAMFFAGFVAGVGLLSDTLHIVVGAMVLAPGFEPLIRIPLGLIGKEARAWKQGLQSTVVGYLILMAGGALAWPLVGLVKPEALDLFARPWVQYWSNLTWTGVFLALAAGATGAAIVSAQRAVLTTGVMIILALIPSMGVVGLALADLDLALAGRGALRWAVDAACVLVSGGSVFLLKLAIVRRKGAPGRISRSP